MTAEAGIAATVRGRGLRSAIVPVGSTLLGMVFLLNVGIGAVPIAPDEVLAIIGDRLGLETGTRFTEAQASVLWSIRLPRTLLALVIGAGLAVAGAGLQGIFRNPLAEPAIIGVSSGAGLGAALGIVVGAGAVGPLGIAGGAFVGGTVAAAATFLASRYQGRTDVVTLILAGVAVAAIAGAGTGLLTFLADDDQLRTIVFWLLGSVAGASWSSVFVTLGLVSIGVAVILAQGRNLDLMLLGEAEARHLGVQPELTRAAVIAAAALATAATVAAAGVIGFVGLVAPHVVRLMSGPRHRTLLPAAALTGMILMGGADLLSRVVVAPIELPIGVVTAVVGGPFFLFLIRSTRAGRVLS